MISKWKYLFWPILIANRIRIELRNRLFDLGIWKSVAFEFPVITVGSLTGNPTLAISAYISKLLNASLHVDKAHGLVKDEKETYIYLQAYGDHVFGSSHKVLGLSEWCQNHPDTPAVVMDQEFSPFEIRPQFKVLVADARSPFYQDILWPVGRTRATQQEIGKADVLLMCGAEDSLDLQQIETKIRHSFGRAIPVFFIKNSCETLDSFKSVDKIEFVKDRNNFAQLMVNVLPNANPESE